MTRHLTLHRLAALALVCALALALAPVAEAQGLAPRNGRIYQCYSSSGPLQAIEFAVYGSATFLRGQCNFKENGVWDWKKCDLAWQNNSPNWEFTRVGEGQCQNTWLVRDYGSNLELLFFRQCSGALANADCWTPIYP